MKKTPLIILGIGILLIIIIITIINSNSVVGNKEILSEIDRISNLPYNEVVYDAVNAKDLELLVELTNEDEIAKSLVDEAVWLSSNDEHEHVGHALFYLGEYVRKAEDIFCLPHELEHIKIYVEHDAMELAEKQIRIAARYQDEWFSSTERKFKKFPQYFPKYEALITATKLSINNLEKGNYDEETMNAIDVSIKYAIC
tara:strand:- start:315 stop:911 length:597 start_codon:yes stop_codon:yes gene_type:complete